MAPKDLQELCNGICASLGQPAPTLAPDRFGALSFTLRIQGVDIDLIEIAEGEREGARLQVAINFGPVPAAQASVLLPLLLESNFLMMGEDAPVFGRDPSSGDIALQWGIAFADTHVDAVCSALVAMSQAARQLKPALVAAGAAASTPDPAGLA